MERKIVSTGDGSSTLYVSELDEHYHSIHGAVQESLHVFIESGFKTKADLGEISILEIGLGTGLNLMLTLKESEGSDQVIRYTGVDKYLLGLDEVESLGYDAYFDRHKHDIWKSLSFGNQYFDGIHINEKFTFTKIVEDFRDLKLAEQFDLVYFDAFGPRVQPQLWTLQMFENMYQFLKPGGVLVTYCAKGQVRRDMQAAGFDVERLPGPPGKREMLRATK